MKIQLTEQPKTYWRIYQGENKKKTEQEKARKAEEEQKKTTVEAGGGDRLQEGKVQGTGCSREEDRKEPETCNSN